MTRGGGPRGSAVARIGWWWIGVIVAQILFSAGSAAATPQALAGRSYAPAELVRASAVLVDAGATLSIDDVRRLDRQGLFRPLHELYGAGYTRSALWVRLELVRGAGSPADWWLHLSPPYLDDVRAFHVLPDGRQLPEQRDGDRAPVFNTVHRVPTFALRLEPGPNIVYLRVRSDSSVSILPSLVPRQLAASTWQKEYLVLGVYVGLELALVVAATLGAVMLRRRVYVHFLVFVVAAVLQRWALSGLLHQWWLHEHAALADAIASSLVGLTAAAGAMFFAVLFEYRRHHRRLYGVILLSAGYMLLTAVAPLFGWFGHLAGGTTALTLLNLLLLLVPLLRHWRTGTHAVRLGVVGFLMYVSLVLLNVVSLLGFIAPSVELLRAAQTGSLVLLFMLLLIVMAQTTQAQRDRAHAQDAATQARAAEERERRAREEHSDLVSMIAHEIRTPVAVIDAARQSLQILDEQPTPERVLRYERIERAVQRMNTLMELALAQDRLEVSTWTHRLSTVDLVGLTKDVMPSLGPLAEQRISLTATAGPCPVQADERMLRFALLNLMDNALKYSPRDTRVTVSVEAAERGATAGCLWRVDDLGQGISEADRERVFHKYFRAAGTTDSPGLGLGLYIVRQIVHRHGGTVVAAPGPSGTGTRFECWLPSRASVDPKESPA